MATKAELEANIQGLNDYIKRLEENNERLQKLVDDFDNKTKMYIQDGKDVAYYNWKNGNSEFLGRYIKEWLRDHLTLESTEEYSYPNVKLVVDGLDI